MLSREWFVYRRGSLAFLLVWLLAGCAGGELAEATAVPQPTFNDYLEAGEELSGGQATVFDITPNAFSQPIPGLDRDQELLFFVGNSFFNQNWVTAPASTTARDGLGPFFNARSCASCHFKDGRGRAPDFDGETPTGFLMRLSLPGTDFHGSALPEPNYGDQLQDQAIADFDAEGAITITYEEVPFTFPDGETVLARYTTAENAEPRRAYLLAAAQNLPVKATALLQVWTPEGQNYAQAFIEADMDGGELQGSMNMLVNQMISDLEEMITTRLGKATGNTSNGQARPDLVESPFAFWSLPRIKATLGTMQAIYNGGDGLGFDDYLDFLAAKSADGEPLSQAIDAQFNTTLAEFDAIEGTLHTAVTEHPDQVNAAYEEVRTLLVLLKVDMANHLGVTLTFNDNDGD